MKRTPNNEHVPGGAVRGLLLLVLCSPLSSWALKDNVGQEAVAPPVAGLLQLSLGLLAVLATIGLCAWLFRRLSRFQPGAQSALHIEAGLSLGARERVVLMRVGSQRLLLGVAPGRIQTLYVLEEGLEDLTVDTEAHTPLANKFSSVMSHLGIMPGRISRPSTQSLRTPVVGSSESSS
ncbi:MAG TPA: flagellar biosynthetic protein FliO [Acidiferrobacteraceae bacterium]|nr:flagellar biosynthetic protein FliO [Acidiferrobacteraceae bacterium]